MILNINETQETKKIDLENKSLNNSNLLNDYKNLSYSNITSSILSNVNSSCPDLYADNTTSGSITVYNKGAYIAFLSWGYCLNGQYCSFESPYIPVLESYTITIPSEATGINLIAFVSFDFSESSLICRKEYDTSCTKCLYLWGTLFHYGCSEIPCPSNMVGGSPIPPENDVPDCNL